MDMNNWWRGKPPWKGKNRGWDDTQPKWFHYNDIKMITSDYKKIQYKDYRKYASDAMFLGIIVEVEY